MLARRLPAAGPAALMLLASAAAGPSRPQQQRRQRCSEASASASSSAQPSPPPPQQQQPRCHPITYHPDFQINPIPQGHRFPMPKDHLLYLALQQEGLAQLTFTPTLPDLDTLCLAHDRQYVTGFMHGSIPPQAMRRIGLPWSPELVQRTLIGTGSAILAARLALQYGVAVMCNGGTHHAHRDHGAGWCILNDQAVAGRAAQRDAGVGQLLFLDLDVHQGDGTATIFAGDPSAFTFSMHCAGQAFPAQRQASDWDIGLPAGTRDDEYLRVLQSVLPQLLQQVQPELVLYNAGVDVHADDALGQLALSNEGIKQRDRAVLAACAAHGVPVAAAIGGGYQPGDHMHIVARHLHLHRAAAAAMPAFAAAMDVRRAAARAKRAAAAARSDRGSSS